MHSLHSHCVLGQAKHICTCSCILICGCIIRQFIFDKYNITRQTILKSISNLALPSSCLQPGSAEPQLHPLECQDWSIQTAGWGRAWRWWGATASELLWGAPPCRERGPRHPTVRDETEWNSFLYVNLYSWRNTLRKPLTPFSQSHFVLPFRKLFTLFKTKKQHLFSVVEHFNDIFH